MLTKIIMIIAGIAMSGPAISEVMKTDLKLGLLILGGVSLITLAFGIKTE